MTTSNPRRPAMVLVPGAWLGGWSWHPVARVVEAKGFDPLPLTLPGLAYGSDPRGLTLADATDHVVEQIRRRDLSDVTLVCHSWGGYPATAAANRLGGRVSRVVYYSAVVPASGVSMAGENEEYGALIRHDMQTREDRTVALPFEAFQQAMMPDEPVELQRVVHGLTVPQPGGYMVDSVDGPPVTESGIDAAYVLSEDDVALGRPGAEFAARLGLAPQLVPGGHLALLTHPDAVAEAILAAAS